MDPKVFGNSPSGRTVRAPSGYWAFVPHPLPPELTWTPTMVAALSDADRALGELAGLGRSLLNPHLLIAPFVRREAVLSSRIEGTQASLSDLYAYEAVRKAAPDVREVHNYVRALEYGLDRLQSMPFSLRLVREIHALDLLLVHSAGLREGGVRVADSVLGTYLDDELFEAGDRSYAGTSARGLAGADLRQLLPQPGDLFLQLLDLLG